MSTGVAEDTVHTKSLTLVEDADAAELKRRINKPAPSDAAAKQLDHQSESDSDGGGEGDATPTTRAGDASDVSELDEGDWLAPVAHDQEIWREDKPEAFNFSHDPEPHVRRRGEILKKHPEIKKLFRKDPASALFCVVTCALQVLLTRAMRDENEVPWLVFLPAAYILGGTLVHSIVLANHELSHDLWLPQRWQNALMAYVSNCPTGVPISATFRRYHLEHHTSQGSQVWDVDMPT